MNISDIKDKDIRELAELRRSELPEFGEGFNRNELVRAFEWDSAQEGYSFWHAIYNGNFQPYYKVYPNHEWRQPTFQRGEEVEVRCWEEDDPWQQRIFLAEIKGSNYPFITVEERSTLNFKQGKTFDTARWKCCRKIKKPTVLTLQMIADKFNLPVDKIKVEGV
jgi:hypothetical protein